MTTTEPKVDLYLSQGCMRCELGATPECKVHDWARELDELRRILLETELKEELKWGVPCYTYDDKNVLLLSAFKGFAALSFFKGALLKDEAGLLAKPGENTQASRYLRFTSLKEITSQEAKIKAYVTEAIEIEKAGLKVEFKKTADFDFPEEFQERLDQDPALKGAFEALTPGRQRGYLLYFSGAKKSETRSARVERYVSKIMSGKGIHDR